MSPPDDTAFSGANAPYLEDMLLRYRTDPTSVDASWRSYFEGAGRDLAVGPVPVPDPGFVPRSIFSPPHGGGNGALTAVETASGRMALLDKQSRIDQLINAYRVHGHLAAQIDPLGRFERKTPDDLDPAHYGFTEADMDAVFSTSAIYGPSSMTLRELLAFLRTTYARTIGCEFMHIHNPRMERWLIERIESNRNQCDLDRETQLFILERLCAAEAFEDFLHVKFRGSKRFSLQGGESLIPLLALLVEQTAERGMREVVVGMPHRGRLNVLTNVMGKPVRDIFAEFDDHEAEEMLGRGDVKYHLGQSTDMVTRGGKKIHLSLTCNPSHLEAVNPVVAGRVRGKQDRLDGRDRSRVLPVLLHGDAAFVGQGLVSETLNLMNLEGYTTGGTIHVVVNNQIGFTTNPFDSRSTPYCTDIAKMIAVPIFHVNGEDPEAVAQVVSIAAEFRQTFMRDVIIDLYCFRRYGHNEADEPAYTQPLMYRAISKHPAVHTVYASRLTSAGKVDQADVDRITAEQRRRLEDALEAAREDKRRPRDRAFSGVWKTFRGGLEKNVPDVPTGVPVERARKILEDVTRIPEGIGVHTKLRRMFDRRLAALEEGLPIDWAMGEVLAFGSLVLDGYPVRLSGQDSCRGTFSHRHAVLTDPESGESYTPLSSLSPDQAPFEVFNSPLSEAAVLGFEFGYSMDRPDALVIWEAQFGDFSNGAQVIIDQFISASEDKWSRISGVVLMLPHGYEGQGPEHSSARLERYLQLCAEDNMQVIYPTTPAQLCHLLRRQVLRAWRKPMVMMSPKSLLRHKRAVSTFEECAEGTFKRVIGETELESLADVRRGVICSGKVYYDLLERRESLGDTSTAIIRLEQLYPLPEEELKAAVAELGELDDLVWCQEEPENMGAFTFLFPRFTTLFADGPRMRYVTRQASASPATGSAKAHRIEQDGLLSRVFS